MRVSRLLTAISLISTLIGCAPGEDPGDSASEVRSDDPLIDRLRAIEGMTSVEELSAPSGHRFFSMRYRQPVHHWEDQGSFEQRLTLLHRSESAPVVLVSTGYDIRVSPSRSEPTRLLEANQVTVEHRFFAPSRPADASWRRLNVQQAAADHHRIVRALKRIYAKPWVSTGASKGGMTSVYHRRFYPKDVVATVAYVAPHDVDNANDAHGAFLEQVGTDPACREGLKRVQREALEQRPAMLALLEDFARERGVSFVGGTERSFEVMVVDVPFIFWQYGSAAGCRDIPPAGASAEALFEFIDDTVSVYGYSSADVERFVPYYYQAASQLGYPTIAVDHIADLLTFPGVQDPAFYVPETIPVTFSIHPMRDIDAWVKASATRLMLIYGEYDPWSAEQFEFGPGTTDSHRYIVPRGNHGANISRLPAAERDDATGRLRAWAGLARVPEPRAIEPNELDVPDPILLERPRL